MSKHVIDAKKAMEDIRSGMSDSALMTKYNLSPIGLQSLITKLVDLGAIRQVVARDLLRDIRAGLTNSELMEKYSLSAKTLTRLFNDMTESGIEFFRERQDVREKKRIDIREIVADVRSGLTEPQLMEKYALSSRGLQSAFWKLVHSGALSWEELLSSYPGLQDSVTLSRMRQWTRSYPILSVPVYELGNPRNRGKIRDLSDKGVGATGVSGVVGQKLTLVLVPDEFLVIKPFELMVECKWFSPGKEDHPCSAGFEILDVEGKGMMQLQELVQLMTLVFE